jgi:predicted TIM-barrel enzyme
MPHHPFPDADRCSLVGMVHLLPLPGSPGWRGDMKAVIDGATRDAERLLEGGCDALLVENMGDLPYLRGRVAPETVAAMALATGAITAMGVAVAAGASFVRVEGFAYAHVADEGWMDACAGELLRARRALGAGIAIWADVRKKHASHSVTADLSLADVAKGTAFCGADALVITGSSTGEPTAVADLEEARVAGLPVVVGSGVTPEDAPRLAPLADALIVGSWLKRGGDWRKPVDLARVRRLREVMDAACG